MDEALGQVKILVQNGVVDEPEVLDGGGGLASVERSLMLLEKGWPEEPCRKAARCLERIRPSAVSGVSVGKM
eukprot:CAMPEP_0206493878 /NCGR_PEP_ID=MMETSP0324_2-20121206/47320_1 /ASSEMBLY_ACC=CAM_ASM_000836 /TAXON_ID=2866 /ORGANISM="Crypthecodinium cohnii, Strain Seligo" /LENGTH=71 /DNA_ID=CAMNT_0053977277 /DNA_START=368 /DNA_END=583 /DNA_ORIENTATION=-